MKIELITNPREHRAAWIKANPQALVENGGLLCAEDLARFACDACMAALSPDGPHKCVDGMTLCDLCYSRIEFECPACGGLHFGRDTRKDADSDHVLTLTTVRCHDQHKIGCKWRGEWPPQFDACARQMIADQERLGPDEFKKRLEQ